ncbi:MAG: class II glutamine amidotransferase [Gammaproteobacteria bacterium]
MCELFALSASSATEVSFSLNEFSKHGGLTNHHRHGWGIAYYQQNAANIIKEAGQASDSPYMEFVKNYRIKSKNIMSHIRYATQGDVSFRNTQPFSRELAGQQHVFIHNGNIKGIVNNPNYHNPHFQPMGDTDSETAFCYLMFQMSELWKRKNNPELSERFEVFNQFANEMKTMGLANFIYSDSEYIYLFSHIREVKDDKGNDVVLPGLYVLLRQCDIGIFDTEIKGLKMPESQSLNVALASSVPLNNENWVALESGQSMVFKNGEIVLGA